MLTVSEMINNEYKSFIAEIENKYSKHEIINNFAWKICEFEQLKNYLECGTDDLGGKTAELLEKYCANFYADGKYNILENIYGFELGYDEPQWATFDDIRDMMIDLLSSWDTYDEDNNRR